MKRTVEGSTKTRDKSDNGIVAQEFDSGDDVTVRASTPLLLENDGPLLSCSKESTEKSSRSIVMTVSSVTDIPDFANADDASKHNGSSKDTKRTVEESTMNRDKSDNGIVAQELDIGESTEETSGSIVMTVSSVTDVPDSVMADDASKHDGSPKDMKRTVQAGKEPTEIHDQDSSIVAQEVDNGDAAIPSSGLLFVEEEVQGDDDDDNVDALLPGSTESTEESSTTVVAIPSMADLRDAVLPECLELMEQQQKQRAMTVVPVPSSILDLPDALLLECLEFVGTGHYRYIAGTCRHFKEVYCSDSKGGPMLGGNKKTTWKAATASVTCAELGRRDEEERQDADKDKKRYHVFDDIRKHRYIVGYVDQIGRHALLNGDRRILNWWARSDGLDYIVGNHEALGMHGDISLLEWAEANGKDWNLLEISWGAAFAGHVPVLQWLSHRFPGDFDFRHLLYVAIVNDQVAVLEWVNNRGGLNRKWYPEMFRCAAINGRTIVLDWLVENADDGIFPQTQDISLFAFCYEVAALEWFVAHMDHEWLMNHLDEPDNPNYLCMGAALIGNLAALQWLRANDFPWDGRIILAARLGVTASPREYQQIIEW